MKKFLLLAVMVIAAMSASAQITWNVKGGVGVAHCCADYKMDSRNAGDTGKISRIQK